jgi:hypothetical protein
VIFLHGCAVYRLILSNEKVEKRKEKKKIKPESTTYGGLVSLDFC